MTESEVERLIVKLVGDTSTFQPAMNAAISSSKEAGKVMADVTTHSKNVGKGLADMGHGAGLAHAKFGGLLHMLKEYKGELLAIVGIGGGLHMLKHSIGLAAEAESALVDFGVMLKSAEKGKEMMEKMREYSSDTHISMDTLHSTTKMMLQNNVDPQNIMPITKMIGDVTGGDAQKFTHLALGFSQMASVGHLQGGDKMQMMNAGFNPLMQMAEDKAKQTGGGDAAIKKEMARLEKEMEGGRITVDMVTKAFQNATKEGGRFFGMVEKQAKTLKGSMATLESEVSNVFRVFGEALVEGLHLPEIIHGVSQLAKDTKNWIEGLDKGTKDAAVAVMAVVAGLGAMAIAAMVFGAVMTTALGGLNLVAVVLISLIGPTAAWVVSVGGVEKAWHKVRDAATQAWEWLKPIRQATASLFSTVLDVGQSIWTSIKTAATGAWDDIFGSAKTNWSGIQTTARDAILYVEFLVTNFSKVWSLMLSVVGDNVATWLRGLADNFLQALKEVLGISDDTWGEMSKSVRFAINYIEFLFVNLDKTWGALSASMNFEWQKLMGSMIDGWFKFKQVLEDSRHGIANIIVDLSVALGFRTEEQAEGMKQQLRLMNREAQGVINEEQQKQLAEQQARVNQAKAKMDTARKALGLDEFSKWLEGRPQAAMKDRADLTRLFEEFKATKLKEFEQVEPDKPIKKAGDEALKLGDNLSKAVKEMKKLEVASYDSSEALQRVMDFTSLQKEANVSRYGIPEDPRAKAKKAMDAAWMDDFVKNKWAMGNDNVGPENKVVVVANNMPGDREELLRGMLAQLQLIAQKPTADIAAANL